jgi:hypothetical protein
MTSKAVDSLVKKYLQMKGFDEVVKLLEQSESKINHASFEPFQSNLKESEIYSLCEDIIIDKLNEGRIDHLISTYNSFRSWAIYSFDFVKAELLLLCLPVFVYR